MAATLYDSNDDHGMSSFVGIPPIMVRTQNKQTVLRFTDMDNIAIANDHNRCLSNYRWSASTYTHC